MQKYTVYADVDIRFCTNVVVEGNYKKRNDPRIRIDARKKAQEMAFDELTVTGKEYSINFVHEGERG
ncbi:hypothetical protein NSQ26_09670 [Bacillus sp. FSL W7-1360]